jgi:hypothetical protein
MDLYNFQNMMFKLDGDKVLFTNVARLWFCTALTIAEQLSYVFQIACGQWNLCCKRVFSFSHIRYDCITLKMKMLYGINYSTSNAGTCSFASSPLSFYNELSEIQLSFYVQLLTYRDQVFPFACLGAQGTKLVSSFDVQRIPWWPNCQGSEDNLIEFSWLSLLSTDFACRLATI